MKYLYVFLILTSCSLLEEEVIEQFCFDPFNPNEEEGEFYQLGSISKFWSSTQNDDGSGKVWARIVGFKFMSISIKPENGYSVRLIKK